MFLGIGTVGIFIKNKNLYCYAYVFHTFLSIYEFKSNFKHIVLKKKINLLLYIEMTCFLFYSN